MPRHNHFQNQIYSSPPAAEYELILPGTPAHPDTEAFVQRMRCAGRRLQEARVSAIYLVHGTFAGNDGLGLVRQFAAFAPAFKEVMEKSVKQMVDSITEEHGNYTEAFAQDLATAVSSEGLPPVPVRRFTWTGENHHLARAEAAVRLLVALADRVTRTEQRILLWGHSHAGNVFALLTNLLGAEPKVCDRFFRAARCYYERGQSSDATAHWSRARDLLQAKIHPVFSTQFDIVNFGTPIRYGWDTCVCNRLLHFVFHRPSAGLPDFQANFPPTLDELLKAEGGDYVQQVGIAGTNIQPSWLSWRTWLANRRLGAVVQPGVKRRHLLQHLRQGLRVANEGRTLLVDYGLPEQPVYRHLAGHAVYTLSEWLPFHTEQIVKRFYQAGDKE